LDTEQEQTQMWDVIFIVLTLVLVALSVAYTRACYKV
jgi:hypothetical protein